MLLQADGEGRATRSVPTAHAATRFVSVVLAMLLAVTMLPVAGLQTAYADEPVERPATSGGDVALEGTNGDTGEAAAAPQAPVAEEREDGMLAADGLLYTVADGGLAFVGFDGEAPEGVLSVPGTVMLDGKETPVVAIDLAEGQVAGEVVVLSLPQGIKSINTATLASAFPALLSVEVASAPSSTLPVAAGAASVRAAYSTSGGMLFRPTSVTVQSEDGSIETIECKELVWAPPALVSARIPVECRAVAEGAFAAVRGLKTVVAFGTMERIAKDAFSTEQMESAKVVVPASSPAVTDDERVSASMALMGDAGQKERRSAWHEAGWRTDDIVMGKPYGSLTETVAVTDEGAIERTELQLVSYPGMHPEAMDVKHPGEDGRIDMAENGLAFTVKSDMTASVTWQGDKTATPSHVDIPATVMIDGVTYPVTEIAAGAFEGAAFLTSVAIPEGVTAIGQGAFKDCPNLTETDYLTVPTRQISAPRLETMALSPLSGETWDLADHSASSQGEEGVASDLSTTSAGSAGATDGTISPFAASSFTFQIQVDTPAFNIENLASTFRSNAASEATVSSNNILTVRYVADASYVKLYLDAGYVLRVVSCTTLGNIDRTLAYFGIWPSGTRALKCALVEADATESFTDAGSRVLNACIPGGTVFMRLVAFPSLADYAKTADIQKWVDDNYLTKAATDLDNFYDKAKFNTISYEGLDEADYAGALPTFYVNDAAKLPKVPEPRREGHEFLGWTWSGQATPTKDPGSAFSGGGAVTLIANWDESEPATPEAKHFFTSDAPLRHDDASATQAHVIKVRLASSPGTLASVSFEGDDRTGLLSDTSGVRLFVGASEDALASGTELPWGGATPSGWSCELARFADGSYGVYVGVSIPTAAIDEASIPVSYADGSYVASLVKMNYAFA